VKGCDEAKAELQEIAGTCWVFDFFFINIIYQLFTN
jgi:hypothetical protein